MKFEYTSPELEIKKFAVSEIITESGAGLDDMGNTNDGVEVENPFN